MSLIGLRSPTLGPARKLAMRYICSTTSGFRVFFIKFLLLSQQCEDHSECCSGNCLNFNRQCVSNTHPVAPRDSAVYTLRPPLPPLSPISVNPSVISLNDQHRSLLDCRRNGLRVSFHATNLFISAKIRCAKNKLISQNLMNTTANCHYSGHICGW
jgi:hypothetical protein